MRRLAIACALAVTLGAVPTASPTAHPITIVINGDALPLRPPPRFERGVLLVPVRRTIEALGLEFNRQGHVIWTQVGAKTVTLTIGSRVARIDNEPVYLDGPPLEFNDVLYAPLHFFTEVLGAQASFDRRTNSVQIIAQLVGRSSDGIAQSGAQIERFGTVSAVDVDSEPPTVTLAYNGGIKIVPIGANAIVEMHDVAANVVSPGELGDVRPGDYAKIFMNKRGHVERVEDAFGSRYGRIAASTPDLFVLADGHVIAPARTTQILLNAKTATIADLAVGDVVSVRYNVESDEIRSILASRSVAQTDGTSSALHIESVDLDADHALRPGDTITVTMHATPSGEATFDIGSYVTGISMTERSAGLYVGSYQLPSGANFSDVPIVGHLRTGTATAADVASSRTLSSASRPPGIADFAPDVNARVNTSRPAIFATFSAGAVPVNPSSVVLWVNGRDVTADCIRSESYVQYMPAYSYPDGPVHVSVRVGDRAGNTTTKSWTFTIRR